MPEHQPGAEIRSDKIGVGSNRRATLFKTLRLWQKERTIEAFIRPVSNDLFFDGEEALGIEKQTKFDINIVITNAINRSKTAKDLTTMI
jgi:hypothetical protein